MWPRSGDVPLASHPTAETLKGLPTLAGLRGWPRQRTMEEGRDGSPTPGYLGRAGPLPLAEERRGPRWACQQPCHLPSRWGVVTRGLSPLPGSVRKMGFQRALLPRAKSIAGTQAAVQTPFKWKLPINQGLYPDANKAVSAHLGKQQAGGDRSRRPGISTWVWASRTHTC